jgi:glycosyltransferase involved in cell wall biosynthesis
MNNKSTKKTILLIANSAKSMIDFRWLFLQELLKIGCRVILFIPYDNIAFVKLQQLNIELVPIAINRKGINPFTEIGCLWKIYQIIKRYKPDLCMFYTIKPNIYGSIASRLACVKHCSMITGLGYIFTGDTLKQKILRVIVQDVYKFALKRSSKIFFLNGDDLNYFLTNKIITKEKAFLINGEGVDVNYFAYSIPNAFQVLGRREGNRAPECTPCYMRSEVSSQRPQNLKGEGYMTNSERPIFLARLLKDKGIYEFIKAARIIKQKYQNVEFDMAGSIDDNPSSIKQAELDAWIKEKIINYLGYLTDVRDAIANSSVFVLPSYREGLPISILEAMAIGRAIISTDAPGCRETVIDEVNGYLVPIKSVEGLVEAMEKFIVYPELAAKMGKESRRIVEDKFDIRKVNANILKILELDPRFREEALLRG